MNQPLARHPADRSHNHQANLKANAIRGARDVLRMMVLHNQFRGSGGALPGEAQLMLELGASRNVIREALGLLREEGLIERHQGTGTFAVSDKLQHRFDVLRGVGDGYPNRRWRMRGELSGLTRLPAPPWVAGRLGLPAGAGCLRVDAQVIFDDVPFSVSTSYLPADPGFALDPSPFNGDWYELLESCGVQLGATEMSVEATVADEYVAPWLDVAVGSPVLLFNRLLRTPDGRGVELGFVRVRGDRLLLQLPLSRVAGVGPVPGEVLS
ncbi:MAG: GntR family transcriptional regulator [Acidimicrobiales bacterium]